MFHQPAKTSIPHFSGPGPRTGRACAGTVCYWSGGGPVSATAAAVRLPGTRCEAGPGPRGSGSAGSGSRGSIGSEPFSNLELGETWA
jgi:hypothetical protein